MAILTCLVVGLVFASRAATGPAHATTASPSNVASQVAIEQIQLGQRVVGRNPLREQTQAPAVIDRATWRRIDLETNQRGVKYDLSFLRPMSWLETHGEVEGGTFHLVMHEIGIDGPARVVCITECPVIEPDDDSGRSVVTGTMSHPAENVLSVSIEGEPEPLGVTTTHPMWSEDQLSFVVAGDLKIGERLRRSDGTLTQVTRITPHTGPPVMVHNLEVDGEHVYCVGRDSLLVHNTCTFVDQMSAEEAERYRKYWQKDLPAQVTPGTTTISRPQLSTDGKYTYRADGHYDEYGRLRARTDYSTHPSTGTPHPDPHHHLRNPLFGDKTADGFKTGNIKEWTPGHVPGAYGE